MILSVTGTRTGASEAALDACRHWLSTHDQPTEAHHGDCVGADTQWHELLEAMDVPIHIHPCNLRSQRSHLSGAQIYPVRSPLVRNHVLVDVCDVLHAFPQTMEEIQRSGTWATIRYARKSGRDHVLFWPDGTVEEHLA